jgi:hypothetical protein
MTTPYAFFLVMMLDGYLSESHFSHATAETCEAEGLSWFLDVKDREPLRRVGFGCDAALVIVIRRWPSQ